MSRGLVYLKLGGSLITDKNRAHTPRLDILKRLAGEIAEARMQDTGLQILIGHGSGSFGHFPASRYQTRLGVKSTVEWNGFVEVWREAADLNHLVLDALGNAGLPAVSFPPSAMVTANHRNVEQWNLDPLRQALGKGLLPVIQGDVVFDRALGGTILSTEDLFGYLVRHLPPSRLLFAGDQPGVWADYPDCTHLLSEISPASLAQIKGGISGSASTDVTGGMADKVRQVLSMIEAVPGAQALIFSGEVPGLVRQALLGETLGTVIHT